MFCAGFFHTRKKFKNFSKEVIKSHLSFPIWCGKRDKHFSNHSGKGVRLMKPSDFQKTVQCRFESCLKKVVRHVVKDYQQGLKRRKDKEMLSCGRATARKIGEQAGAKIVIGRRVLYSIEKVKKYLLYLEE